MKNVDIEYFINVIILGSCDNDEKFQTKIISSLWRIKINWLIVTVVYKCGIIYLLWLNGWTQ